MIGDEQGRDRAQPVKDPVSKFGGLTGFEFSVSTPWQVNRVARGIKSATGPTVATDALLDLAPVPAMFNIYNVPVVYVSRMNPTGSDIAGRGNASRLPLNFVPSLLAWRPS